MDHKKWPKKDRVSRSTRADVADNEFAGDPDDHLHLPSPPTDEERGAYFRRRVRFFAIWGLMSTLLAAWATVHMALSHSGMSVLLPVLLASSIYLALSFLLVVRTRDRCLRQHEEKVAVWNPASYPSVDVWLPVCGEPLEVLRNAWRYTSAMNWAGTIGFYVADDADSPQVKKLAEEFGFQYFVRPDKGVMKKAGNLRYLYQKTQGDFAVIFDADFCPRNDFLAQLMPYFDDSSVGIIQSPQFFRALPGQHWLERGAAAVQEFFYRVVQTTRHQWKCSAICVGTNAIYRRRALDDNGGTTLIEHSEDVHTGFDLRSKGWQLHYVPAVLATGICPDDIWAFMRQQYRWCAGSMSLILSRKFWGTSMPLTSRCCYLTGLGYYGTTALQSLLTPLLPISLLLLFPQMVHLDNYLLLLPAFAFSFLIFPFWHKCHWGIEAWTTRLLYGWAHFFAFTDLAQGRPMGWTPTGVNSKGRLGFRAAIICSMAMAILWVGLAVYRCLSRPLAFAPLLLLGVFFFIVVARIYVPRSWYLPRAPMRVGKTAVVAGALMLFSVFLPSAKAYGVQLGIIGSHVQYAELKKDGLPLSMRETWESWASGASPAVFLAEARNEHAVPVITWEPIPAKSSGLPRDIIPEIIAGDFDPYIRLWAETVKKYHKAVYIRFAHEMNGEWYPWSDSGPRLYVQAWRHVWNVFHSMGASNALFVWSPDGVIGVPPPQWEPKVVEWYPGARYVNYVGMSTVAFAYNVTYGQQYFFERIDYIHHEFGKPFILPEMKVLEADRYVWLRQLRSSLKTRPWIKSLLWTETPSNAQAESIFPTGNMDWALSQSPLSRKLLKEACQPSGK